MRSAAGGRFRLLSVGVVLGALSVVSCLALWASNASASKGVVSVFGSGGSGDGQFSMAGATAVNATSGDVYVVDQFQNRVERFDATGAFLGAFGWGVADGNAAAETCTSGCQPGIAGGGDGQLDTPQGIAIDQSDGSVYVVDGNNSRVEKFDAGGTYQSQFGTAGSAEGQFSGPQGIAVDPTDGSVYVVDSGDNRVEKFDNTGAVVDVFGAGVSDGNDSFEVCTSSCQAGIADSGDGAFNFPTRVAVDSTGKLYVLDAGNGRIERFTPADAFDEQFDPTDVNGGTGPVEIAIRPANDDLYVAQSAPDFSEQRVFEIDSGGSLVDTHGVGSTASNVSGLALGSGNQKIYVADGFNARVFVLDDITAPTVTINPVTGVTAAGASLSGSVTPNGTPDVGWHFEISTDDANWSSAAGDQNAGNGNSPVAVSQDLAGLVPDTTYFVRLAATRPFNAPAFSSETQFTTTAVAPSVTTEPAQDIGPTHAALPGLINPNNQQTTYYFQYGTTTHYGTDVPAAHDGDAGATNFVRAAVRRLEGLESGTTYHFRLVATNPTGTTVGQDQTFTTTTAPPASSARSKIPGSGFLPDDRGWEKVSPNDKNGGDVIVDSQFVRAASDGSAVGFASLSAFTGAVGTGVSTDYMSTRSVSGWETHAITPPQKPLTVRPISVQIAPQYDGSFSSDLSKGVFLGWSPVTQDPDVANVPNLYLRTDLRMPGAGLYQLVTACPLCQATSTPLPAPAALTTGAQPYLAGASADFGHVLFESQESLTGDAPTGCNNNLNDRDQCPGNLYDWDHGTVRLAGILPDDQCGSPPCPAHGSVAGQGAGSMGTFGYTPHTISADGTKIFFTVPGDLNLYMRVDHTTTIELNASERTDCADHDPCNATPEPDPGGTQQATYWDASVDGSRVFFTTNEALTNDAPTSSGGSAKLYMYDTSKPDSDPHNLTFLSPDNEPADSNSGSVQGVAAVSDGGHYVYFTDSSQLVPGEPVIEDRGLFVWHDGTVRFIAPMNSGADVAENSTAGAWLFTRRVSEATPDGLHLLFSSTVPRGPTGFDQTCPSSSGTCRQLYVYSYATQRVACASCNQDASHAGTEAFSNQRQSNGAVFTTSALNHPMSDDGRRVFFSTAEALVPQDVDGKVDAYEYDVPTGTLHLISNGRDTSDSFFVNASASGDDAFVITRAQLVGADADKSYDLYDARVGGGFPELPPPSPMCSGESCRAPQTAAPGAGEIGSGQVTGSGNVRNARKAKPKPKPVLCRHGYVRKKVHGKVRCVKKPKPRHKARKAARGRGARRVDRTHGRAQ